jgi:hypothetical protein
VLLSAPEPESIVQCRYVVSEPEPERSLQAAAKAAAKADEENNEQKVEKKSRARIAWKAFGRNLVRLKDEREKPGGVDEAIRFGPVGDELGLEVGRCCAPRSSSARLHGPFRERARR